MKKHKTLPARLQGQRMVPDFPDAVDVVLGALMALSVGGAAWYGVGLVLGVLG